jgi:hypothetical protein
MVNSPSGVKRRLPLRYDYPIDRCCGAALQVFSAMQHQTIPARLPIKN